MIYKLLQIAVFITLLLTSSYAKDKNIIYFSPLPMKNTKQNIQDFVPLNSYIEDKLNIKIKYIHNTNYQDIIEGFIKGNIDLAYLGPLPLVALKQQYPFIQPLVSIQQSKDTKKYRCVLTKFKKDTVDISKPIKIALTQPLSTCGYFMTQKLLLDTYNIDLTTQKYQYLMSHQNAILSVLEGDYMIAGAKDSIAKKYETVGMEIIAQSEPLPGFSLVANVKTLTQQQIKQIEQTILNIDQQTYTKWKGIFSKGFIKADIKDYDKIEVNFHKIPKWGNIQ